MNSTTPPDNERMQNIAEALAQGLEHQRSGNLAQAEQIYRQIVAADPNRADAWSLLGTLAQKVGRHDLALEYLRQALNLKPDSAINLFHVAASSDSLGRFEEAEAYYRRALALAPNFAEAHYNLSNILRRQGKKDEMLAHLREAVRQKPTLVEALNNLGNALGESGEFAQSVACYREACRLQPQRADGFANLGNALLQVDDAEQAAHCFQRAIQLRPDDYQGYYNLANALRKLDRRLEAIPLYRQALELNPETTAPLNNLATALIEEKRFDEARTCLERVLQIDPDSIEARTNFGALNQRQKNPTQAQDYYQQVVDRRPDLYIGHFNLGNVLGERGYFPAAETHLRRAVQIKPDSIDANYYLGVALKEQGKLAESIEWLENVLRLDPEHKDAHFYRSMVWLQLGEFERGWPEYEWRWAQEDAVPRHFPQPLWDGSPLDGKTLLLHAEQGYGDILQFCRYVPLVKEHQATKDSKVIFEAPERLVPMVSTVGGYDQMVEQESGLPPFDLQCPLMTLPRIFGTTLVNVPNKVPYLSAKKSLVTKWKKELQKSKGFKIGITWQGNPNFKGDRYRSFPLACFRPLAALPGVQLISLQSGPGTEQTPEFVEQFSLLELGPRLDKNVGGFMDTAAVMRNLDLVICPNTAAAHLAGALGVPVWVPLSTVPEWRFLMDRDDSPWYPTMRVFRQREQDNWTEVFERMKGELEKLLELRAKS